MRKRRITKPFIYDNDPFSPLNNTTSYRPKSVNLERMITLEELVDMSVYELRIIMMFLVGVSRRVKLEDPNENQELYLSYTHHKHLFSNPNSFSNAKKSLIKRGFLRKVEGKKSTYAINPKVISNLSLTQEIALGYRKDFRNRK